MNVALAPWLGDAWSAWAARLAQGRVPHALLVAGPAGLGKRAFASALVASLLCGQRSPDGHACGTCRGCRLRASGAHPDHVVIGIEEDASSIKIDQVRALSARLSLTSQFGGMQVALLDPAEAMTHECANALLKTLEEPSADTVIVLVSDEPARLTATIRSRCQRIDARFPARAEARAWLQAQGVDAEAAESALEIEAGNPGAAARLLGRTSAALLDSVGKDLRDLAHGRSGAAETAARWARDEPRERVTIAAQLARCGGWQRTGAPGGNAGAEIANLTASVDFHKLAAWWDRANLVREQLRTPLRADLLLLDLLRDWRALGPAARAPTR